MRRSQVGLLAAILPLAYSIKPPAMDGMNIIWSETFKGNAGSLPESDTWGVALAIDTNNELQTYTDSSWIFRYLAARRYSSFPANQRMLGKKLRVQTVFRLGDNTNEQGIWPAFWMMGDAVRNGVEWPLCGELDVFEQVNGQLTATGTVHCQQESGGICNEPSGHGVSTSIPDNAGTPGVSNGTAPPWTGLPK
ncbi:hypothetical protein CTRI78_v012208 [Colletotrichum trifolii]|uniref:GH16 domain-containing protein n=1 Tax=Colletotrichum trifolii TaxID=5466 RepID=A0A4R8PXE3_COLTR|nr:hypothetical protein CTRI78_v012208 [Colletotrichum trifolii]